MNIRENKYVMMVWSLNFLNARARTKNKEKPAEDLENNMGSTYEKCPKTGQSMLGVGRLLENYELENRSFSEISDLLSFQEKEILGFNSVLDTKRVKKQRKGPEYRIIRKYVKSKNQYWRERNRRKKAWELSGLGFSYKQIAEKLGVSEKTVQRDIKKIRPYYYRLSRAYFRKLDEQRQRRLREKLEGATIWQQLPILRAEVKANQHLLKQREYNRHMLKIIIDMDGLPYGFPVIRFWPKLPISLRGKPYHFQFHIQINDKQHYIGKITLN